MAYSALPVVVTGTPIATTWGNQVKADADETAPAKITTAGDLVVGTGPGALARLAAVAAGQVLKSNGAGASPVYGQVTPSEVAAGTYAVSISGQAATAASATTASGVGTLAQNLLFVDNTYDIGASGATRPRNVYVAGTVTGGTLASTGGISANGAVSTTGTVFCGGLTPTADNAVDIGTTTSRWRDVYCARGAFNGSSRALKRDITRIEPADALAAVRATEVVTFRYKPTGEHDAGADRWHVGYVAEDCPDLLAPDHATVTPQTTASVALAAIQALAAEVADLKAQLAAALAGRTLAQEGA